jgi:hypothetical protein
VSTEEAANSPPNRRRWARFVLALRNAKAAPRAMIPSATRVNGMYRVDMTAANTGGNAVHSSTTTKISQTWLASHTGPMLCSMSCRCGAPRREPPASKSQAPAPKSAPANST